MCLCASCVLCSASGVSIDDCLDGSNAASTGLIEEGMEILLVNDDSVAGLDKENVVRMLKCVSPCRLTLIKHDGVHHRRDVQASGVCVMVLEHDPAGYASHRDRQQMFLAKRAEAARTAAEKAARVEAERLEAERVALEEAERLAALEAERVGKEEAERSIAVLRAALLAQRQQLEQERNYCFQLTTGLLSMNYF